MGGRVPNSPASDAGIESGDIIVRVGKSRVPDATALRNRVSLIRPGKTVEVTLFRDGERKTVEVVIGRLEDNEPAMEEEAAEANAETERVEGWGLTFQDLTADSRKSLGLRPGQNGAAIASIASGALALQFGLQIDDVLVSVGGTKVSSAEQASELLSKTDFTKGVRLAVIREGVQLFLFVREN